MQKHIISSEGTFAMLGDASPPQKPSGDRFRETTPDDGGHQQPTLNVIEMVRQGRIQPSTRDVPHGNSLSRDRISEQRYFRINPENPQQTVFDVVDDAVRKELGNVGLSTLIVSKGKNKERGEIYETFDDIVWETFGMTLLQVNKKRDTLVSEAKKKRDTLVSEVRSGQTNPDLAEGPYFKALPGKTRYETVKRTIEAETGYAPSTLYNNRYMEHERFKFYDKKLQEQYGISLTMVARKKDKRTSRASGKNLPAATDNPVVSSSSRGASSSAPGHEDSRPKKRARRKRIE